MIQIMADNKQIPFTATRFSDGTLNINIPEFTAHNYCTVTIDAGTPTQDVLMLAHMVGETLCMCTEVAVPDLHIEYLPNARADRVFKPGDAFPLYSFLFMLDKVIESYYNYCFVHDVHNPEGVFRNYPNITNIPAVDLWAERLKGKYDLMIIPDKGAVERCSQLADALGIPTIQGFKKRDLETGQIVEIGLEEPNTKFDTAPRVLIFDDICDGGGTFIPLADQAIAMGAETVDLAVTHGIFAKGLDIFNSYIDNIHVRNFVGGYVNQTDILHYNEGTKC